LVKLFLNLDQLQSVEKCGKLLFLIYLYNLNMYPSERFIEKYQSFDIKDNFITTCNTITTASGTLTLTNKSEDIQYFIGGPDDHTIILPENIVYVTALLDGNVVNIHGDAIASVDGNIISRGQPPANSIISNIETQYSLMIGHTFNIQNASSGNIIVKDSKTVTSMSTGNIYVEHDITHSNIMVINSNVSSLLSFTGDSWSCIQNSSQPLEYCDEGNNFSYISCAKDSLYIPENYRIIFPTLESNTGNAYNTDTGIYTCPQSGNYIFSMWIKCNNNPAKLTLLSKQGEIIDNYMFYGDFTEGIIKDECCLTTMINANANAKYWWESRNDINGMQEMRITSLF